jgi:ABC-type uncharacterized transport system permease subunit
MNFRRHFFTTTQRLTYISVCLFALSQYVFVDNPWRLVLRVCGTAAILGALLLLFTTRLHRGCDASSTGH